MNIYIFLICLIISYLLYINYSKIIGQYKNFSIKNIISSDGIIHNNKIKKIQNELITDGNIKFKKSVHISKALSKDLGFKDEKEILIPELENFYDYAPEELIKFSETAFQNVPEPSENKVKSTLLLDDKIENETNPVNFNSEMTVEWYEKTSKNAHSHYFKLMDDLPRVKVPIP